jgi:hypothetical protein
MAISKLCLNVFGEMVGVRGGLLAIQSLSTIKKGTSRFNFPIQLFLFEVSTTTLSIKKNLICPQSITYNPCPEGFEWVIILKDLISRTFNYVEQNGYLKIVIECVWINGGRGKGVSSLPITFVYYKGHWPFQFPIK